MTGYGVSHHIDSHHLDMIVGAIITGWAMLIGVIAGITITVGTDITITTGVGETK